MFALTHICILHPIAISHLICVFFSLVDDTHIVGPILDMVFLFMIIRRFYNIRTFSVTNKVCSLISTKVIILIFSRGLGLLLMV